jgi:asparagine synthase (glutamine-hydrolysing)
MCGIAGIYGTGDIRAMTRSLAHRGPDDEGVYESGPVKLGARRLAVIDLASGHQPLSTADGKCWITYNGELFNYLELRQELEAAGHRFLTRSDTEVVVAAYQAWGAGCLDRFIGMFAFAIWDGGRLFLARDRFGEKPLYYCRQPQRFLFASEIKALLVEVDPEPCVDDRFPVMEAALEPDTLFRGIVALEPAHYLIFDGVDVVVRRYWSLPEGPLETRPPSDLVEELRALIADAVRLRMRSDVPVGLFLSGGLDSSLLAGLARPPKIFTCHLPYGSAFDESAYASVMAETLEAERHVVSVTAQDFERDYPKVIWHLEQPIATTSSIAEFALARLASRHVKVAIGGQGADEAFGGYVRYLLLVEERRLAEAPMLREYQPLARVLWGDDVFGLPADRYFQLIRRGVGADEAIRARVRSIFARKGSLVDHMGAADFALTFPSLITMNDRAAAAFGVENRTPFLDHRVVEFAFRLPMALKIDGWKTKAILRQVARGIVPDAIVDRPDKKGLGVPVGRWLTGELKDWARELSESLSRRGIELTPTANRGLFDRTLFTRVSLELWFRTFIDGRGKGPLSA